MWVFKLILMFKIMFSLLYSTLLHANNPLAPDLLNFTPMPSPLVSSSIGDKTPSVVSCLSRSSSYGNDANPAPAPVPHPAAPTSSASASASSASASASASVGVAGGALRRIEEEEGTGRASQTVVGLDTHTVSQRVLEDDRALEEEEEEEAEARAGQEAARLFGAAPLTPPCSAPSLPFAEAYVDSEGGESNSNEYQQLSSYM